MATPIPENHAAFTIAEVLEATAGTLLQGSDEATVAGVSTDSRHVAAGDLYVALRGEQHDGHVFAAAAIAAGARALLVSNPVQAPPGFAVVCVPDTLHALGSLAQLHRRRWGGRVVAITGSSGKTTTKELAYACLHAAGLRVTRTAGNLNNLIGVPMSLLCLDSTTDIAVLELGTSAPGEIARLAQITQPDIGVVTGVSAAHTEGLGSLAEVAREKASLLAALPTHGVAIYDADSAVLVLELDRVSAQRKLGFGRGPAADVQLLGCTLDADLSSRCAIRVGEPTNVLRAEMRLFGPGPALDAAAALAVVLAVAGPEALTPALLGLASVDPADGRLNPRSGPDDMLIVDDSYNANPASMTASIEAAAAVAQARKASLVLVLGDMLELGAEALEAHTEAGRAAVRAGARALFTCGMQMRAASQAAWEAAHEADAGADATREFAHADDAVSLLVRMRTRLLPRDVVLVKGSRGMRMERVVEGLLAGPGTSAA